MCRLVVVLQDRTFVYDLNSTTILEEIETVPNTKGKDPTAVCLPNIDIIASAIIPCCQAGKKYEVLELFLLNVFAANIFMFNNQVSVHLLLSQKSVIWLCQQAHPKDLL